MAILWANTVAGVKSRLPGLLLQRAPQSPLGSTWSPSCLSCAAESMSFGKEITPVVTTTFYLHLTDEEARAHQEILLEK